MIHSKIVFFFCDYSHSQISTPLPAPEARPKLARPYSSPLHRVKVGENVSVSGRNTPLTPRTPTDRCKSVDFVDWRGRVQPDTVRYK